MIIPRPQDIIVVIQWDLIGGPLCCYTSCAPAKLYQGSGIIVNSYYRKSLILLALRAQNIVSKTQIWLDIPLIPWYNYTKEVSYGNQDK